MEQMKMSLKTKWILAALALGALIACMKAGDGMGLDSSGKVIPFCTTYPNDPSCKPDPCAMPTSKACSTSMCEKDSSHAWCHQPVDCMANPTTKICADSCTAHPLLAWCSVKVDCNVTPSDTSCAKFTKFSQVYPLFKQYACNTCHSGTGAGLTTGKLNLSTIDSAYANLVNQFGTDQTKAPGWKRVVAGQPDSSILFYKLSAPDPAMLPGNKEYGARMPFQAGYSITATELAKVKKWIQDGALK